METGKIEIRVKEENKRLSVHIELSADDTVWLTKHQIADLFGVYVQTVTAGLKTIRHNGLFNDNTVRTLHYVSRLGKQCSVEFYNLETIIALSYHMKGGICLSFREWLHEQVKHQQFVTNIPKTLVLIQLDLTKIL